MIKKFKLFCFNCNNIWKEEAEESIYQDFTCPKCNTYEDIMVDDTE